MKARSFSHVGITVSDFNKAVKFYSEVFGCPVVGVSDTPPDRVRSFVRDPAQRELLFDLETARRRLFEREGKTAEADLLDKCAANLMRMWCDD